MNVMQLDDRREAMSFRLIRLFDFADKAHAAGALKLCNKVCAYLMALVFDGNRYLHIEIAEDEQGRAVLAFVKYKGDSSRKTAIPFAHLTDQAQTTCFDLATQICSYRYRRRPPRRHDTTVHRQLEQELGRLLKVSEICAANTLLSS